MDEITPPDFESVDNQIDMYSLVATQSHLGATRPHLGATQSHLGGNAISPGGDASSRLLKKATM